MSINEYEEESAQVMEHAHTQTQRHIGRTLQGLIKAHLIMYKIHHTDKSLYSVISDRLIYYLEIPKSEGGREREGGFKESEIDQ